MTAKSFTDEVIATQGTMPRITIVGIKKKSTRELKGNQVKILSYPRSCKCGDW